jgi:hypothetical protein
VNPIRTLPALALVCAWMLAACGGSDDASVPPQLTAQPASATVDEDAPATFSAAATGSATLTWQWLRNGVEIAGATGASYTVPAARIGDTGALFSVVVQDAGGKATSGAATLTVNGAAITQTIGPAGGSIGFTSNGTAVTVTFAPGALTTDTSIGLRSRPPAGNAIATVGLQPAGISFAQPVTIALGLPADRVAKATTLASIAIADRKVFVPTHVDVAAKTVTTQLPFFGVVAGTTPTRFVGVPLAESKRSALATAPPPPEGTLTLEELAVLQVAADTVNLAIGDLQANGRFEDAAALQLGIAALVQSGEVPEYQIDAERLLQGAATSVCLGLDQAVELARGTTVATYGDYQRVAKGIVYWESASQALGADGCAGSAWSDVLHAKLGEALAFIEGKVQPPPAPSGYSPVGNEIRAATGLAAEAAMLRLSSVAADTRSLYIDPALQPLRVAAFETSRTSSDQSQYLTLLTALGPVQSLSDDAQFAATTLRATSKSRTATTLATKAFGKGASVGAAVKTGTLQAKADGTLEIAGDIAVLHCPGPAVERLQLVFEGIEVANIGSSGDVLLGTASTLPTLSMASLLSAAHIVPATATQHLLVVRRLGSSCAGAFQIVDDVLAAITLDFTEPDFTVTLIQVKTDDCEGNPVQPTDLTLPLSFTATPCPGVTTTMSLAFSDSKTVTYANETSASGYFNHHLRYSATFAKAGTVTIAVRSAWAVTPTSLCVEPGQPHFTVQGQINLPGNTQPITGAAYNSCNADHGVAMRSMAVGAGDTLVFESNVSGNYGLVGSGVAFTMHFEPTP